MRSTTTLVLWVALMFVGASRAQDYPYFPNQTGPFLLKISASGSEYDGMYLSPQDTGLLYHQPVVVTAINSSRDVFYFNTTFAADGHFIDGVQTGLLVWNLLSSGILQRYTSPLQFQSNLISNVITTAFFPSSFGQTIGFDLDNKLCALWTHGYRDATIPSENVSRPGNLFYNWHVCQTFFNNYNLTSLNWVTGGEPINRSCRAVNVTKEAV
ncbi:hypothetical protein B0T21DRAFT_396632 [Apiosordaria backusii]|uniref:Uncharacterized protein n=1 Tax=Apiosordaria backusii TaxID=314023 RepID=A0AA40DRB0_9PEZI|nr:hypothetical protein B0T21DRAFT_396632 [Apiosordaria backusii]